MTREIAQGIYFLKKCIMVLQAPHPLPVLLPLCERLIGTGIGCEVILSEELPEKLAFQAAEEFVEGILYLTDDPQAYSILAAIYHAVPSSKGSTEEPESGEISMEEQPPVLIYLHEGNQDEDFGDARYALEEPEETEPEYLERVYRRCHNLPWEILVTERCWLRETIEEDVDSFWKMYQDAEITRYTERLYPTPDAERGYIREYRRLVYSFYEFGVWTVLDRQSGAVVGRAGLSVREGYDLPELGFVIGRKWQGRGLAGEVCQGILKYAREQLGFDRIQVLVHEENAVSLHLCRKLGFREQAPSAQTERESFRERTVSVQTERESFRDRMASAQTGRENMPDEPGISPHSLVEMEQDGQQARFVYMVCEQDLPDKS